MTSNACGLVKSFAADPRTHAAEVRRDVVAILAHVDDCPACELVLDEASDAEAIFDVLADEESLLSVAEREALDRWTTPDTKRTAEVEKAVDQLIWGLQDPDAAKDARKFDASSLHAATEAVSLAIRGCVGPTPTPQVWVQLHEDGAVSVDGLEKISARDLAAEIAVVTNDWAGSDASGLPAPSYYAEMLARWSFRAVRQQRHLFRHFRAMPAVFGPPFTSEHRVVLVPLSREERIDNLYERWRPELPGQMDALYIARAAVDQATTHQQLVAVMTKSVAMGLRDRDQTALKRLQELGLGTDGAAFLGPSVPSELGPKTIGGPLEPLRLDPVDSVTFRGRTVELGRTSGSPTTFPAERIVWRWDVLGL